MKIRTVVAISLTYIALSGCQQVQPTRNSTGRLTESAVRAMEADMETQKRLQRNTNYESTPGIPLYGAQFR